jgi:hypothetical protein
MTTELIVTIKHVRDARLCVRGARMWFQRHGLNFEHFLSHGYPVEVIEGTGDAMGKEIASRVRAEAAGEED